MFSQGDIGDAAYIVIEGEAEVLVNGPAGPFQVVVGEIAILCDVPRTATIKARERLVCLRISKELFLRLLNEFPQIAIAVVRELAHRIEMDNAKLQAALAEVEKLRASAPA